MNIRTSEHLPDPETIRRLLDYDAGTGLFWWKQRPVSDFPNEIVARRWNTRFAGTQTFKARPAKYCIAGVLGHVIYGHRAAWAHYYGEWPVDQIDHINGDPSDNRIANLRTVPQSDNVKNSRRRSDNTSGVTGVVFEKRRGHWVAQMHVSGRCIHLGGYANKEDAISARKAAEVRYGFHPNHGRAA